jgi:hypothetical protein
MERDNTPVQMHFIKLGVALFSFFCITTNFYLITCSKIIGLLCFFDLYYVQKIDFLLHHIFVLILVHRINNLSNVNLEIANELISVILSTEISSIFLNLNKFLETDSYGVNVKKINNVAFVSTFVYYRIYNYTYYLILNKKFHNALFIYYINNFEFYQVYIGVYGLFILNLYWSIAFLKKTICKNMYIETVAIN